MTARPRRQRPPRSAQPPRDADLSALPTGVYDGGTAQVRRRDLSPAAIDSAAPPALARHQCSLFFSCHGGTGSTTLAVNLATLLARSGQTTCVVDMDLQFGDVLTALNLKSTRLLSDLLLDPTSLEPSTLRAKLPRHDSGVCVVSQVGNVDGVSQVTPRRLGKVLGALRSAFDVIILDGTRDFNDHALTVLDSVDRVVMVATQELATLKGLMMRLELYSRLSYPIDQVQVVLNRFGGKRLPELDAMAERLWSSDELFVRNDPRTVGRALREGRPLVELAPRAAVARDMVQLAQEVFGVDLGARPRRAPRRRPVAADGARGRGLLSRMLGRRKR